MSVSLWLCHSHQPNDSTVSLSLWCGRWQCGFYPKWLLCPYYIQSNELCQMNCVLSLKELQYIFFTKSSQAGKIYWYLNHLNHLNQDKYQFCQINAHFPCKFSCLYLNNYIVIYEIKGCVCHFVSCRYTLPYPRWRYTSGNHVSPNSISIIIKSILFQTCTCSNYVSICLNCAIFLHAAFCNQLIEVKNSSDVLTWQTTWLNFTNPTRIHLLEVVVRGRETQLHVGEKLDFIAHNSNILWNSIALTSIVVTELANTMKYGRGGLK